MAITSMTVGDKVEILQKNDEWFGSIGQIIGVERTDWPNYDPAFPIAVSFNANGNVSVAPKTGVHLEKCYRLEHVRKV